MVGDDDASTADLDGALGIGSGYMMPLRQNWPFYCRTISATSSQFMDGSSMSVK
jgi:hypothetical protein